ncbi:MAG TPA: efflux RND transporter permease subunit [Silvibacterium sp.]|nr:efflux RND transporter permease subunit [Silvibacterium sp.]
MPKFALRYPFFIIMLCLVVLLVGVFSIASMPVDLFPKIDLPVVVVATFYSGMPPEQVEADITDTFERFFTLGSNIDHIESRSLTGVSLIKVYFRPGTDPNAALSNIANLAMADLRRLPPGTLPPVVLSMDASNQPVCLVTLKGQGLNETRLKDLGQFAVRNQIANVPGASAPEPYGGTYRQIQVYVDPVKLEAHNLSLMDVVHAVDSSNLILPAGDVRIGAKDFNIYANAQFPAVKEINSLPIKTVGNASVLVADVGRAEDAGALQTNIVRIDGQRSVYVPVFKQGGDSNTITIVNGVKNAIKHLVDVPDSLKTAVVFDQSVFVKLALKELVNEATIGLVLTGIMVLLFLGSPRATIAVLLSVPLSAVVCLLIADVMGGSINTMLLGGLALALSRLIDNGVVVLENIFRYMEMGEPPRIAAEKGGSEVSLAVLAATVTTSIVFFPVTSLTGVSKYLFTPLALGVVLSIFASYVFAMTVIPLFCATFLTAHHEGEQKKKHSWFQRIVEKFNVQFQHLLDWYERAAKRSMGRPGFTAAAILVCVFVITGALFPFIGRAYFPRTDTGQFVINVKMPSGTRIEVSNDYVAQLEQIIRQVVPKDELNMVVSNIGITHGPSTIYSNNSSMDTAFVQVSLKEGHKVGSHEYMNRVRAQLALQMPELTTYFQGGGLVDAVINQGLPAPIDVQVKSNNLEGAYALAQQLAGQIRQIKNVSDVYIPQDMRYPGLALNIDRERASLLGLSTKQVMNNVITALTSDGMVAPSYWIDPKTGNNYMLTVQYFNRQIGNMSMQDFRNIPLRGSGDSGSTPLQSVADISQIKTPTEVDHYQIRRVIDIYVATKTEALQQVDIALNNLLSHTQRSKNTRISIRGAVVNMNSAFRDFGFGLLLAIALVYLVLMAQFGSFVDPFIILMAIPPGLAGVVLTLLITGSTLNIMSLMGTIMMTGIVVSNSILIVDFAGILHRQGLPLLEATVEACKMRLRPILMTSLATLLGMVPMALGIEAGSEQYAPLARAIIGGLGVSVVVTMFLVPAVYLVIHGRSERKQVLLQGDLA